MKLTPKLLIMSELLLVLAIMALLAPVLNQMHQQVVEDLQNRISAIAATAALDIDGDKVVRIRSMADTQLPVFAELKAQLEAVRQANQLPQEHIYTFYPVAEKPGYVGFGVMTHDQPFTGDLYEMRPLMKKVLMDGSVEVTGIYGDEHGTWISAYAPIKNSQGQVVAILEVDEHATAYFSRLRRVTFFSIGFALLVIILTSLLGWYRINQIVLYPLSKINQGVQALGRREFNHRVALKTDDEFESLANTLNDVSQQLDLASVIQRTLQPASFPPMPGYRIASLSRPCDAAGGDYCDLIHLDDGRVMIVMADVSGHGIGPALLMASCRSALRVLAALNIQPAEMISRLGEHMAEDLKPSRFITMFVGIIEPSAEDQGYGHDKSGAKRMVWSNAAHAPAMIVRQTAEGVRCIHMAAHRTPVGVVWFEDDEQTASRLEPNDLILVASDGLIEALDSKDNMFGMDRVERLLTEAGRSSIQSLTPEQVVSTLENALSDHIGDLPMDDDLTILCLAVD